MTLYFLNEEFFCKKDTVFFHYYHKNVHFNSLQRAIQEGEVLNNSYTALLQPTGFPSLCEMFNICKIC